MYTLQESFNMVAAHLRKQKRSALLAGRMRRYRAPNGDKCAIGALILDEHYRPEFEGQSAHVFEVQTALVLSGHRPYNEPFFNSLQAVHDCACVIGDSGQWMADVEMGLKNVAKVYHLVYTPPSN